jgi:15-cis-phytoene synthase
MRPSSPDRRSDLAECGELLRGGSRTFFAASLLLPRSMREPASALYAFCRLADDAVDLGDDSVEALDELRERLARMYQGRPMPIAADRALAEVVARYGIPRALPEALLEGFEWDAAGRRYEDLSDLLDYAARVAGTVGAMMSVLMGGRAPEVVARACDLGVAMQLTNIARDVGEDARAGRVYLPLAWLREAGIDPDAWLESPGHTDALGAVVQRLLNVADELYGRASAGIARLPLAYRPGMHAARIVYAEIGREVERQGLDSVSSRAIVSGQRKVWLAGRAVIEVGRAAPRVPAAPLEATRFLVEAVEASSAPHAPSRRSVGDHVAWLIDLFTRLEQLERGQRLGRQGNTG